MPRERGARYGIAVPVEPHGAEAHRVTCAHKPNAVWRDLRGHRLLTHHYRREGRLPDYRKLPEGVRPGELLALLNTGAYTVAQMFPYNGRPLPAVVLVKEGGGVELIRRRDTYEDLLTNEVW